MLRVLSSLGDVELVKLSVKHWNVCRFDMMCGFMLSQHQRDHDMNESEEMIQCSTAVAQRWSSLLSLVEISAGAVGGVWRAKREQQ